MAFSSGSLAQVAAARIIQGLQYQGMYLTLAQAA